MDNGQMNNRSDDAMGVVFISDKGFIVPTCVALTSLAHNKRGGTKYDVFIILVDCDESDEKLFYQFRQYPGIRITIIRGDISKYREVPQTAHVTTAALLKFDVCDLIPEYDKLLYMDGDLIIRDDLTELYGIELRGKHAAVVKNAKGILDGSDYFFSGLILFDAAKMREDCMGERLTRTRIAMKKRTAMDMTAFNIVLKDKVIFINPKYDCPLGRIMYERQFFRINEYNAFYNTNYRSWGDLIQKSLVVHFCGAAKPWRYSFGTCNREWKRYYDMSPLRDKPLKRKNFFQFVWEDYQKRGWRIVYYMLKDAFLELTGPIGSKRLDHMPNDFV